jgi:putative Mg2+ transporter-C (MgtC) family protein
MIVGMVIGTEREYTNRPAGMRTHILVALGAASVMITGQMIFLQYSALGATPDPSRLSAQVITGVGFLGAGTILREGTNVKGLTTAASLWAVACLGIAAGAGYYAIALAGMVFIFITLTFFEAIQDKLVGPGMSLQKYILETDDIAAGLGAINTHATKQRAAIRDMRTAQQPGGNYRITFQAEIGGIRGKKRRAKFLETLAADPAVVSLQIHSGDEASVL